MRRSLLALALLVLSRGSDAMAAAEETMKLPSLDSCQQLILVLAKTWSSTEAKITLWERSVEPVTKWVQVESAFRGTIGRSGLAWGSDSGWAAQMDVRAKREGDGCSPAGLFRLKTVFGVASDREAGVHRFDYRQIVPGTEGIDDPASRYYNRIVDPREVVKDWRSSEQMYQPRGPYRWGVVVDYNSNARPAAGSCIFLHLENSASEATAGCTAMAEADLLRIIRWLDRRMEPRIVQLPVVVFQTRQREWGLPPVDEALH